MEIIQARLRALIRRKLLYEENQRIAREFQEREMALVRARAEKEAAEVRAALADQLAETNRRIEAANRELRETQAQLVQSAKMASLGQLVAGVAHEINNPLAFVISHLATVDSGFQDIFPEVEPKLSRKAMARLDKIRQRLRDMRLGLDRIRDLVVKLRTFSRLDEGEFKHVDIEECIESVLTLLQHRLKGGIKVTRKYGDVKIVPCYPGPLNQVIMNVISNAIDAIEDEGEITIATGRSGPMFFITITDTGKGVPAAARDRVFDPFFTTKSVGEGTGLGLYISYGIVKKHGGEIEICGEEGKGTEVIVRIPMERRGKDEI
jgi:two-component system NtrC family sensor kinase